MGLILLRYGEIALKGQNRAHFFRKLRHNVRKCLAANEIRGTVWQEGQRVYVQTDQMPAAMEAVQRVFGIVSLSPVEVTAADLDAIAREAVGLAARAGVGTARPFRIRARRADKSFPHLSPEIDREVGAAVVAATGARVDLSRVQSHAAAGYEAMPPVEIGIEVHRGRALVFGETIAGPGGLPLSSQGRVVALLSSGIDSPVAAWLMMKRGCGVIPVHFSTGPAQTNQVLAIVEALNRYAYGQPLRPIVLSHDQALGPVLARLRTIHQERWTCLFCKRTMLARAAEIAEAMGAGALVTGDSLGQVASQTLSNLEVISYGVQKPILRPLIGMDKTEIMALARKIGTYDVSTQVAHSCPYLPSRPKTQSNIAGLAAILEQMSEIPVLSEANAEGASLPRPGACDLMWSTPQKGPISNV